ncbi:hypothetical protein Tco_1095657, partial [Tanacetum coccineum]
VLNQNVEEEVKDDGFVAMEQVTFEKIMDEVDSKTQDAQENAESPYDTKLEIKIIKSSQATTISGLLYIYQSSSYDQEDQDVIDISPKDAKEGDAYESLYGLRSMPDDDLASMTGFEIQDSTDHSLRKVNQLEPNITKHVSDSIQSIMPLIVTNTRKEQLPGLLSDALKDTLP